MMALPLNLPFVVDAHLDLAFNALAGRDLTWPLARLRNLEGEKGDGAGNIATVTLPELRAGRVGLVFATLFAQPVTDTPTPWSGVAPYTTPEDAAEQGRSQLGIYSGWARSGLVRLVRSKNDLAAHVRAYESDGITGLVILMEGCDPILTPEDAVWWWEQGVSIFGLAWQRTRYCGGTGAPGGLTPAGWSLLDVLGSLGAVVDVSHMAEAALDETLSSYKGPLIASHSNARAIVGTDRQLSDAALRALAERGAVVGLALYNKFLEPRWSREDRAVTVTLQAAERMLAHMADHIGWANLGIGSDLDGGFGSRELPEEIESIANLARIAKIVPHGAAEGILGGNWLRFLAARLRD